MTEIIVVAVVLTVFAIMYIVVMFEQQYQDAYLDGTVDQYAVSQQRSTKYEGFHRYGLAKRGYQAGFNEKI
jgi:hypothetical protein